MRRAHVNRTMGTRLFITGALIVALASCGSSKTTSAPQTTAAAPSAQTTAAPSAATTAAPSAATTAAPSGKATGDPVKIISIVDESTAASLTYPTLRSGMKMAADYINDHGGLGGSNRPVNFDFCPTQFDPNIEAQCATDAVNNSSVIATVANVSNFSDVVNGVLEKAGLASVAPQPYSASDGQSKIAFPVNAGYLVSSAGMATELADVGNAKKISAIYVNVPAALAAVDTVVEALASRGLTINNKVPIDIGTADVAPQTAELLGNGTDGVVLLTDPQTAAKVVAEARKQGSKVMFATNIDAFTPAVLASMGAAAEGLFVSGLFAFDDVGQPGVKAFTDALKKYGNGKDSDDFAKQAWVGLQMLDAAAKGLATIDRKSILDSLTKMTKYSTGGLTPDIDYTVPGTLLKGTVPRFTNGSVAYAKVEGGVVKSILPFKWYYPFEKK
jgi:ABC-type branched-subunit amino acid transport system substrate-binding protein